MDEKYAFVIAIACGELRYEGIVQWLEIYVRRQADVFCFS